MRRPIFFSCFPLKRPYFQNNMQYFTIKLHFYHCEYGSFFTSHSSLDSRTYTLTQTDRIYGIACSIIIIIYKKNLLIYGDGDDDDCAPLPSKYTRCIHNTHTLTRHGIYTHTTQFFFFSSAFIKLIRDRLMMVGLLLYLMPLFWLLLLLMLLLLLWLFFAIYIQACTLPLPLPLPSSSIRSAVFSVLSSHIHRYFSLFCYYYYDDGGYDGSDGGGGAGNLLALTCTLFTCYECVCLSDFFLLLHSVIVFHFSHLMMNARSSANTHHQPS